MVDFNIYVLSKKHQLQYNFYCYQVVYKNNIQLVNIKKLIYLD